VKINFPYPDVEPLEIPESFQPQVFDLPDVKTVNSEITLLKKALSNPIGTKNLKTLVKGKKSVLIVVDDITRPTPIHKFIKLILAQLELAAIKDKQIQFLIALGTHRPMTKKEMRSKLGGEVVKKYQVRNHNWKNPDCLQYVGDTEQGVPVWINKLVSNADLVIGLGSIMPIEVCGFTGGGKILVPGVCGQITCDEMHWTRIDVPSKHVLGKAENPVRASIDSLARKAGLDFIANVILDSENKIIGAAAGDMVAAHRLGCELALKVYGVKIPHEFDIVIADSFPFDIEFWQANKALDTAGEVVKKGGVVILVSPCYEGFSQTHCEMFEFGYPPVKKIKQLVNSRKIKHKVVGVHMTQVARVLEKAKLILVSTGIKKDKAEKVGFLWAQNVQEAFTKALEIIDKNPSVAVLKNAARMLPLVTKRRK
jgi:nickel-dependent lactate racemase